MVMNSSYVTVQNMNITSLSNSTTLPKNTDGLGEGLLALEAEATRC